jgi:hypothetical protein
MNYRRFASYTALALLAGCKIEIDAPVEGSVTTTSSTIECAAGQTCTIDIADTYFDETFEAVPATGWQFAGWKTGPAALCGDSLEPCNYSTTVFQGNENIDAFLENQDIVLTLQPVFAVERTTDGITLAGEQNQTAFGLDFDFDFYRNNTYSCGLSGNYTFMVVNPANGDETVEAPLWVFLHGGGAGFYDENGDYQAVGDQTEDTWNREETFNDFLIEQLQGRTVANGQPKDITLTRRIQEGYRVVMVSMCDHDQYSGLGTPYPNHPNSGAEVNGMQATMSAVEYTVANYPTTEVFAHGTSAGSVGVYNLAMSFAAEAIYLTGVVADSILSPRAFDLFDVYPGQAPRQPGWTYEGVGGKQGFYGDTNRSDAIAPEGRIDAGFDEVPLLFVGGTDDPFCFWDLAPIPEAATAGLNNCEWAAQGLIDTIAAQPGSPHQVANMAGEGHIPTNTVSTANDIVDTFIGDILAGNPDLPFRRIPGYNMMMMGHSFFKPMAEQMPFHAVRSGVAGHTQTVEFSGGATGAPLALWNDAGHRANVQAVLDTGTVELFGMTYEPTSPTTEGYELWFDYALSKNPDTKFFIGLPWADFPSNYADAAAYANFWQTAHDGSWHFFIDQLRALYPGVEIFCIPYGQAALELRTLLEAGSLPDLTMLTGVAGDGLFRDNKGHGHEDEILYDTAELVWQNAIYGVELDEYAYDPDYITDIKAIAKSIMDEHDPDYNGPNR